MLFSVIVDAQSLSTKRLVVRPGSGGERRTQHDHREGQQVDRGVNRRSLVEMFLLIDCVTSTHLGLDNKLQTLKHAGL